MKVVCLDKHLYLLHGADCETCCLVHNGGQISLDWLPVDFDKDGLVAQRELRNGWLVTSGATAFIVSFSESNVPTAKPVMIPKKTQVVADNETADEPVDEAGPVLVSPRPILTDRCMFGRGGSSRAVLEQRPGLATAILEKPLSSDEEIGQRLCTPPPPLRLLSPIAESPDIDDGSYVFDLTGDKEEHAGPQIVRDRSKDPNTPTLFSAKEKISRW